MVCIRKQTVSCLSNRSMETWWIEAWWPTRSHETWIPLCGSQLEYKTKKYGVGFNTRTLGIHGVSHSRHFCQVVRSLGRAFGVPGWEIWELAKSLISWMIILGYPSGRSYYHYLEATPIVQQPCFSSPELTLCIHVCLHVCLHIYIHIQIIILIDSQVSSINPMISLIANHINMSFSTIAYPIYSIYIYIHLHIYIYISAIINCCATPNCDSFRFRAFSISWWCSCEPKDHERSNRWDIVGQPNREWLVGGFNPSEKYPLVNCLITMENHHF